MKGTNSFKTSIHPLFPIGCGVPYPLSKKRNIESKKTKGGRDYKQKETKKEYSLIVSGDTHHSLPPFVKFLFLSLTPQRLREPSVSSYGNYPFVPNF